MNRIEKYRPWPLTAMALILLSAGMLYLYDLIILLAAKAVQPTTVFGFLSGTTFSLGLAWGIWRLEAWARVTLVWLCILLIAVALMAIPFLFVIKPAPEALNLDTLVSIGLALVALVFVIRYLGKSSTRQAFEDLPKNE